MKVHVLRCDNNEVTDFYLDMLETALRIAALKSNHEYESDNITSVSDAKIYSKSDYFIVATSIDALKLYFMGYTNIIIWFQGVNPEESFMRNNSKFRFNILSMIEKYVLKRAIFKLFVSREMIHHYENKYNIQISDIDSMVIPCFNEKIDVECFEEPDKYVKNRFCYVGSTAKWQKFEEIILLYKKIEQRFNDASLIVLTRDIEKAERIIKERKVKEYTLNHVNSSEISKEIRKCKFGFIIRDDCTVNQVSTPTKLSNYMASGVIPIFSSCIKDFSEVSKGLKYVVKVEDYTDDIQLFENINNLRIVSNSDICNEYKTFFEYYYNDTKYIDKLVKKFLVRLFNGQKF